MNSRTGTAIHSAQATLDTPTTITDDALDAVRRLLDRHDAWDVAEALGVER